MKILFVSHENNLGGATRSMLGIIDNLIEDKNNKIWVFVPKFNEDTTQGKLIEELEKRHISYIYSKAYWWMYPQKNKSSIKQRVIDYIKVFCTYYTSLKISRFARKNKIELIHSNSSVSCLGALIAKKIKCKHIWHIREFGQEDHGLEFVLNKEKSLKFMKKNTDKFICISNSIYEKYESIFGKEKCEMIFNGININEPFKLPIEKENNAYNILISGRIKESKGQKEAIEAIRELRDKGYYNLKLYIAGVCYDNYITELKEYIKNEKLENNIEFCGFIKDMTEFRKKIDIELVCSKMEAFGRVTIEAMLNSNPVIGANSGGTKELIIDEQTGLLYQQGNSKSLSQKIEKLIVNYELRKKIAKLSYEYARENFTTIINAKKVMELYEKILY